MNTMAQFLTIVDHVLASEGGYVDHPNDPGGETNFGISKRSYPDLDIQNLTRDHAIEIYRLDYWLAYRCNQLPTWAAAFLFDALVQHRPKTAVRFLQGAVGVNADGVIGPITIKQACRANIKTLLPELFAQRLDFYAGLAARDSMQAFRLGWFRRMANLQHFIYSELTSC